MATITADPGVLQPDSVFYRVAVDNVTSATANTYSFETDTFFGSGIVASTVTILGSFTYPGGTPSGTVAQVLLDTDADGINDFTIAYPASVLGILDDLLSGDQSQFFGAAFFQNDTISLGGVAQSSTYEFYLGGDGPESNDDVTITGYGAFGGDASNSEAKTGGNDVFTLNSTDTARGSVIAGDFHRNTEDGAAGGNDTIEDLTGAGNARVIFYGDLFRMNGDTFTGGDDLLIANNRVATLSGDVGRIFTDGAVLNGGDDTLLGSSEGDSLYGDYINTFSGSATYTINGGDDSIEGGAGNDTIYGDGAGSSGTVIEAGGNDTLRGGDDNDVIFGGSGDDFMFGDAGDDLLHAGAGVDTFLGGIGVDTVDFSSSFFALTANLVDGPAVGALISNGITENVFEVENIIATNVGDNLTGNSSNNTFDAGAGNDTIDGDTGTDIVSYARATSGVTVDLSTAQGAAQTIGGGQGIDRLTSIEGVIGSDHADTIYGGATDDSIDGGAGDDILLLRTGFIGFDEPGTDTISGGSGDDTVGYALTGFGQANFGGVHDFDGGTNTAAGDTFAFETFGSSYVVVLDSSGSGNFTSSTGTVRANLTGFENVIAGNGSDAITVYRGAAYGNGGNDTLSASSVFGTILDGGAGNDSILGSFGDDILNGGNESDTIDAAGSGIFFDADTIDGGAGNDRIILSTNTPTAGRLGDMVEGGSGTDTAIFEGWNADHVVSETGGVVSITNFGDLSDVTTLSSIEFYEIGDLTFSQADFITVNFEFGSGFDDIVTGTTGDDVISGNLRFRSGTNEFDGDDALRGLLGDDTLMGGRGDDTLRGDEGADVLLGGSDTDLALYFLSDAAVTVDLALGTGLGGHAQGDTLTDIENVMGSNNFGDQLLGDLNANNLRGRGGDDTLVGNDGNDTLVGDSGLDDLDGGAGNDELDGGSGADTLEGGGDNDTLDGGSGDDRLKGDAGEDRLDGEIGSDTLLGGNGNDSIFGGDDDDTIAGGNDNDNLRGEDDNDLIYGNSGNDTLLGGNGDDTLFGGGDNDTIAGGNDNDDISGDAGDDFLFGNNGEDTLDGEDGNDELSGGNGDDLIFGRSGEDTLRGANEDDRIFAGADDDLVAGNLGNDTVEGGSGNDRIFGGGGNDILIAGEGTDTVHGGSGSDTFVFETVSDSPHGGARDSISDFAHNTDLIDLSGIMSGMTFIGSSAYSGIAGEVRYNDVIGRLYIDTDGDSASEFSINIVGAPTVDAGDLIL